MYRSTTGTPEPQPSRRSSAKGPKWALAGFDLDGTLIYRDTVLRHVGRKLGRAEQADDLVRKYEAFELDNTEVSTEAAKMFAGLRPSDMSEIMNDVSVLDGIPESISRLHRLGIKCVVATVTFDFASKWFASRYGFDAYNGIELEVDKDGRLTGGVLRHVDENDKAEFIRRQATEVGVPLTNVLYVGDSRSDLPTFRIVGYSIAINASPEAKAAAITAIETRSLVEVVDLVPELT